MATKKRRRPKKQTIAQMIKKHFTNIIVILSITAVVIYTAGCMFMKYERGVEPSPTLTVCYFGVFGIELGSLAAIKKSKVKYMRMEEETNDCYQTNNSESER